MTVNGLTFVHRFEWVNTLFKVTDPQSNVFYWIFADLWNVGQPPTPDTNGRWCWTFPLTDDCGEPIFAKPSVAQFYLDNLPSGWTWESLEVVMITP